MLVALAGNPNAGKTTLFNALTGLRAKTANFPGTTVENRVGPVTLGGRAVRLLDLPGLYSIQGATPEEALAQDALTGRLPGQPRPDVVILIVDSTNLERNLYLASQIIELNLPMIVALNMTDLAKRRGIAIDHEVLSQELSCPVVPIVATSGKGVDRLRMELETLLDRRDESQPNRVSLHLYSPHGCQFEARYQWAQQITGRCIRGGIGQGRDRTQAIDQVLTHPVIGVVAFMSVMFSMFALLFWIAQYPMEWIDGLFSNAGWLVSQALPEGDLRSLLVEGVIGGVGGMLVFLPQICILFFFLSLLEDTGYLARAAFVMDRLMRQVGLPGKAFVPLLSSHACAIPGIMAARIIDDKRDRLVTILVAPLMTCSARIPVYAMVTALLFPDEPIKAALVFTGAYSLGIVAALGMSFIFKHSILKGQSKPLILELPSYKIPSLRNAFITAIDRARVFIRKAGTVILAISIVLWWLATYPKSEPPPEAVKIQQAAQMMEDQGQMGQAAVLYEQANQMTNRHALAHSAIGRMGHAVEPVIRPLGFDWQVGIGLISSFAAREVIVSTLAVVYGVGADAADDNPDSLYHTLRSAVRSDGSPVFTTATCLSLLVFYVLAMQCLPTQAVTRRETGSWKWPIFQLVYMTALAYTASLVMYQVAGML